MEIAWRCLAGWVGAAVFLAALAGCFEGEGGLNPSERALRKLARHMAPMTAPQARAVAACTRAELAGAGIGDDLLQPYFRELDAADLAPARSVEDIAVMATPAEGSGQPARLGEFSLTQLMGLGQAHVLTTTFMWACIADKVPVKQFSASGSQEHMQQDPAADRGRPKTQSGAGAEIQPLDKLEQPRSISGGQPEPPGIWPHEGQGEEQTPQSAAVELPAAMKGPTPPLVMSPRGPGRTHPGPAVPQASPPATGMAETGSAVPPRSSIEPTQGEQGPFSMTLSGLQYRRVGPEIPQGLAPRAADRVCIRLIGWTADGAALQEDKPGGGQIEAQAGLLIPGLAEGLQMMREGERFVFVIPPHLGYGERGHPNGTVGRNQRLTVQAELIRVGRC